MFSNYICCLLLTTELTISSNSVSINGNGSIIAIGAPFVDNASGEPTGQITLYAFNADAMAWQIVVPINGEVSGMFHFVSMVVL